MSRTSHKTDFIILAVLGFITVAVLFALIAWPLFGRSSQEDEWLRTSFSTNVNGTKVFYTLLEKLGYSVQRLQSPFLSESLKECDILLMIDPPVPLGEGERIELEQWVRQGGVLLCNADIDKRVRNEVRSSHACRSCESGDGKKAEKQDAVSEVPAADAGLPLAEGVAKVRFSTSETLELTASDTQPAKTKSSSKPLFSDSFGPRIAVGSLGAGKILVCSDSSFLANGFIGFHDNAILAVNLIAFTLAQTKGQRIAFDENHFDFNRQETGWPVLTGLLFTTAPGWAALCLTAAGILYLLYKGRRFGPRRPLSRPRRRSKLEFVYSVAAAYRSAGAHRLAFSLIFKSFKHQAARSAGLPESAPVDQIAVELARRAGKPQNIYLPALDACEKAAAVNNKKLSARQITPLLDQLKTIELEAIHGTAARK